MNMESSDILQPLEMRVKTVGKKLYRETYIPDTNILHSYGNTPSFECDYFYDDDDTSNDHYQCDGNEKIWHYWGVIHRDDDKPAIIFKEYEDDYYRLYMKWFINGVAHRDNDEPAYKYILSNDYFGKIYIDKWYKNGIVHRDNDKPAQVISNKHGIPLIEIWYKNGIINRDNDEAAIIVHDKNGHLRYKFWVINGILSRHNSKYIIVKYRNDKVIKRYMMGDKKIKSIDYENGNKIKFIKFKTLDVANVIEINYNSVDILFDLRK